MTPTEELARSQYALLTTYRRDGRAVATPVWIAALDGDLGVWTVAHAGKVKRIRRDPTVTVATCDVRGRNAGAPHAGRASVLDRAGSAAVRRAIGRKYGVLGRLTLWLSRVRRGRDGTVGIRVVIESAST